MFRLLFVVMFSFCFASEFDLKHENHKRDMVNIYGNWIITNIEVDGNAVIFPREINGIRISVLEDRISGNAGCNNFMIGYTLQGTHITISENGAMTKKMCEPSVVSFENAFMGIFSRDFDIREDKFSKRVIWRNDSVVIYMVRDGR